MPDKYIYVSDAKATPGYEFPPSLITIYLAKSPKKLALEFQLECHRLENKLDCPSRIQHANFLFEDVVSARFHAKYLNLEKYFLYWVELTEPPKHFSLNIKPKYPFPDDFEGILLYESDYQFYFSDQKTFPLAAPPFQWNNHLIVQAPVKMLKAFSVLDQ